MPTIPRFHVTQDPARVFVHVHVPYVRVSEMEFYVDGTHFTFFCKPYLLKLQFPHEVVDDELAKAVYDPNKEHGTIVVHLPKKEPGQEFEDLDMLTKLLQPKEPKIDLKLDAKAKAPLIEVLNSSITDASDAERDAGASGAVQSATLDASQKTNSSLLELEERITDTAASEEPETVRITNLKPTYGFNNGYSDFFRVWHGEITEILSLPDPENIPADQRRILREAAEEEQFDVERYLLDFINKDDDMYYQLAMGYEPFWKQYPVVAVSVKPEPVDAPDGAKKSPLIMEVVTSSSTLANSSRESQCEGSVAAKLRTLAINGDSPSSSSSASPIFSDADRELLLRLPHKEYLIERGSKEEAVVFGGLVDILIGFTYDHLTSQGDSGIESTWAVSIISPTLGWLDTTADLGAVVRTAVRRILSFPFLRQYDLAMHVLKETAEIFKRGKRVVLRALLELHRVVEKSETQYLLNTLYIQDYCVWIQSVTDEQLLVLSERLEKHISAFKKADSGWGLEDIERSLLEEEHAKGEEGESSSDDDDSSSEEESSEDDESSSGEEGEEEQQEGGKKESTPASASMATLSMIAVESLSRFHCELLLTTPSRGGGEAMNREEVRAASHSTSYASRSKSDDSSSWRLKLPFLCARPGNVGVQIDSYRTMTMFSRPRCGKFTKHFQGIPFENSSMENYSRVLERTSKRARIVEDRLAKLRAREQEMLGDDERRRQRRRDRELARQRKLWLHHQSLKKSEQRQREEMAATVMQRYTRGMLARRERCARMEARMLDQAARTLQRSSKRFLVRKQRKRRAIEKQKERQVQAATTLQRQTRKRLAVAARKRLRTLDVPEVHHCQSPEKSSDSSSSANSEAEVGISPARNTQLETLGRHISLDLLFSDDEGDESPTSSSTNGDELNVLMPESHAAASGVRQVSPKATYQPKRPVSIKRVGGGFRTTSFAPTESQSVVPTRVYTRQQQQPPRRVIRGGHLTEAMRSAPSPLAQLTRRPSVPSSSSRTTSSTGGAHEVKRSSRSADKPTKQLDPAPEQSLPFGNDATSSHAPPARRPVVVHVSNGNNTADDNDANDNNALEELVHACARSHVAE